MARRLAVLVLIASTGAHPAAQTPTSGPEWRNGKPVALLEAATDHLVAERIDRNASGSTRVRPDTLPARVEGGLRLTPRPGWTHTRDVHRHFRLEFAFRGAGDSSFTLYFRAWPLLDKTGVPPNAHALRLRATGGEWHTAILDCRGPRSDVLIDGTLVATNTALQNSAGYIGFRADTGEVEIRDLVLTPLTRDVTTLVGLRLSGDAHVQKPRVRREMKPRYTEAAMRQRIQGAVLLELLVNEEGSVADVAILESLDPVHGLDRAAVAAARDWRFHPAIRDGKPVAVIVTLELQFTLK